MPKPASLRLLGVDLASQPANTSIAVLEHGRLAELHSTGTDELILALAANCDAIGIDAPLGWPDDFIAMVTAHHGGTPLPHADPRALQLRRTDEAIIAATGKRPLSVSTDRIGVVALRAIRLLESLRGPGADRSGASGVYETYPGGAVATWRLVDRSYKKRDSTPERRAIVDALGCSLDLGGFEAKLIASDDDLDALLCAAIVGLAVLGHTTAPEPDDLDYARREGWIHVPTGAIEGLAALHP